MTDSSSRTTEWQAVLQSIAQLSGHELRNALNALVVNLEVVRTRSQSLDASVRPFVTQSVEQAEQSVSVAEGAIGLLNLVVAAIDETGSVRARSVDGGVSITAGESDVARVSRALQGLVARSVITANTDGSAIILRVPDKVRHNRE